MLLSDTLMEEWEVKLAVSGPIFIKGPLTLDVEKGYENPFLTTVELTKAEHGVCVRLVARATNAEEANDAAVYFVGQMLDVLCLWKNLPLHLSLSRFQFRPVDTNTRRLVRKREWRDAFRVAREYSINEPAFIRALSWYRKGVNSEDPIDKFIAFWSSLEGIGASSARQTDRTAQGAINQICDVFDQLWGDISDWEVIPNDAQWVNRFHETRNGIAHGFIPVNVDTVREVIRQLSKLRELTYACLSDWGRRWGRASGSSHRE